MKTLLSSLLILTCFAACGNQTQVQEVASEELHSEEVSEKDQAKEGEAVAYFASGCFWCVEEVFEAIIGVREAVSGYSGGSEKNPTYRQVSAGQTSHAEAVMVIYDPNKVSFEILVDAFFASQDPTTPNRQGPDAGTQYRSIAFYSNEAEKKIIEQKIKKLEESKIWSKPIVTEIKKFDTFWLAEDYHQDYVKHNPSNPYVQSVSLPRFNKFKSIFNKDLLTNE